MSKFKTSGEWICYNIVMATSVQRSYIKDLAVLHLKEFKEFKEMIYAEKIVSKDAKTVADATTIDAILDATTDLQASKMIDALLARKEPKRSRAYSSKRAEATIQLTDKILKKIGNWDFDELRRLS